jgi:hypothetical protein
MCLRAVLRGREPSHTYRFELSCILNMENDAMWQQIFQKKNDNAERRDQQYQQLDSQVRPVGAIQGYSMGDSF